MSNSDLDRFQGLSDALVERRERPSPHRLSLLGSIYIERGTVGDWHSLKSLHYKTGNDGVGPRFYRCMVEHSPGNSELIGVIVFTVPKMADAGRNAAFLRLRPNRGGLDSTMTNKMRTAWVNKNMRLSSRNVLDTMYRGAGLGYRFRNIAMRMAGFEIIEARSSMSRFNPFYWKAGMKAVQPKDAAGMDAGLAMFARNFESPPYDITAITQELAGMKDYVQRHTLEDMRDFYYKASSREKTGEKRDNGRTRVDSLPIKELLKEIMQLTFGATIYAVYKNPDAGRALPERIPASAFDNQATDAPLRLDLL